MKKSGMLVGKREVNLCSRLELHFTPTEKTPVFALKLTK